MKIRTAVLTTICLLLIPSLTYAVFFDKHTSSNNTFSATTLDSEIAVEKTLPETILLTYKEPQKFTFKITNLGKLDTINSFEIVKITDEKFASLVNVFVLLDEKETIYKGPLLKLYATDYITQNKGQSNGLTILFEISKEDFENTFGKEMDFVIRHHAGQFSGIQNYGFFDKEDIHLRIVNPLPVSSVKPLTSITTVDLVEQILNNE